MPAVPREDGTLLDTGRIALVERLGERFEPLLRVLAATPAASSYSLEQTFAHYRLCALLLVFVPVFFSATFDLGMPGALTLGTALVDRAFTAVEDLDAAAPRP